MNSEEKPAIVCNAISKTYGEGGAKVIALRDINLRITQGELRLLMGPSGSGKTTLISTIAGLLTQSSGDCLLNDISVNHLSETEKTLFRRNNIGFVFQAFNLIPSITVEENICIPLLLNDVPREIAIEKSKHLLHDLGMADKIGVYPKELSGGQQQRIAIARGIVHQPKFVVCDEPTSFLDHITGGKIMELLRQLVKQHKVTMIVVTHDPRIMEFADKIDHIEDGMITNQT